MPNLSTANRQAERARLIAEAKAKAAQDKHERKRKESRKIAMATRGVEIISSGTELPPPAPSTTMVHSSESYNSTKGADVTAIIKARKESKVSAAARVRAEALLTEARQKVKQMAVDEARAESVSSTASSSTETPDETDNVLELVQNETLKHTPATPPNSSSGNVEHMSNSSHSLSIQKEDKREDEVLMLVIFII